MTNIIGQVTGGTISNGQGCYGASLLPDTFKKILLTLAEDRCRMWKTDEPYHAFSLILTGFDESEKFRAVIYPNFEVLLQEK